MLPGLHLSAPTLRLSSHPGAQPTGRGGLLQLFSGGPAPATNPAPALQTLYAPLM